MTLIMIISLPEYFAQKTCHLYKTVGKLTHYCFNNEVHLKKIRISFPKETCLLVKCVSKLQSQVVSIIKNLKQGKAQVNNYSNTHVI